MTLVNVALIGAGTIAGRYRDGIAATPGFAVTAVAAVSDESASRFAAEHRLRALPLDQLLADPSIAYVINCTPAHAHAAVTRACLDHGKSVYSEKPLAPSLEEADALIAFAEANGLLLACAPATFLWPPLRTTKQLIDEGRIGQPIGALITLVYPGPELFHPNPAHLYGEGGGPLLDMGVYQVAALIDLLGPVGDVVAMSSKARHEREVRVGPRKGQSFAVEGDTHVHALLRHDGGPISNLIVSFDAVGGSPPRLEIFGSCGSITLTDWHAPTATLRLVESFASPGLIVACDDHFDAAAWAVGPTQAWVAFQADRHVSTNARFARETLAVLLKIKQWAVDGG